MSQQKNELQVFIEKFQKPLKSYAVRKYSESAFLASLKICIMENPNLQKALKTPQGETSLFAALRQAAATGLSLNPRDGKACLIAYERKDGKIVVDYQPMKNGYIELAMASGKIDDIVGMSVREGDEFDFEQGGLTDKYKIKKGRKDRGKIDGYFAAIKFKNGIVRCEYMTHTEVQEHKKKYGKGLEKTDSAWNNSEEGMSVKTVVKKILTTLKDISKSLDVIVEIDNLNESILYEKDVTPNGMSTSELLDKLDEPEKPAIEASSEQKSEKKEKDVF